MWGLQKCANGCSVTLPFLHIRKRDHHARAVYSLLQTTLFCSCVASLFGTSEKRDVTLQRKLRVCKSEQTIRAWRSLFSTMYKRGHHAAAVWLFLQTPRFCMSVASPFLDVRKRGHHARTVCTLLQKWSNGSSVAVPFWDIEKRDHHADAA